MKTLSYKNSKKEETEKTNLWDAFVDCLDNMYFPGASETLDANLLDFEYENFKSCH